MTRSEHILIVDDDRQVREVLHQIFLGAGYKCLLASDGREGVEVFREAKPPLTVTDLKMPIMGGYELLQQVRDEEPDAAVIVLTGAADVKTAIASLKLGAYDFIMKPVNVDELLIAAERALDHDIERGDDAAGFAVVFFPGLDRAGNFQIGYREAGQSGFGLGTDSRGPFVPDLAAGARRCPGERRAGADLLRRYTHDAAVVETGDCRCRSKRRHQ